MRGSTSLSLDFKNDQTSMGIIMKNKLKVKTYFYYNKNELK